MPMKSLRILSSALVLCLGSLGSAQAQSGGQITCGQTYTVVAGDTLREIATRAYGAGSYQIIFNANQNVLANPNLIEIGDELFVPCTDGSGPRTQREAEAEAGGSVAPQTPTLTTEQRIAQEDPVQRKIKFLTGGDYAPFTDEALPEGGLFTDLVKRSMTRADDKRPFRITFINDWGPHLGILLPEGAFDLGFPWFKPDCTKIDRLSESMAARCTNFDFSHPFYEVVIGFYVRKGDPAEKARSYADLFGRSICRPRGYFTFDLEQEDLKAPNVRMEVPATPGDCFRMLASGEVDVVSLNVLISEKEIAEQGIAAQVSELSDLAGIQTMHVLSPKNNPYGRTYLTLINRGLRDLRESGDWFEVVSRHLSEHAKRSQ